jgi:hypothetical protein
MKLIRIIPLRARVIKSVDVSGSQAGGEKIADR